MNNLKSLVNDKPLWDSFLTEMDARLSIVHTQMEQVLNAESLYRLQGEAQALRKLKHLREHING
jgi:hypothetical protein|tara:strand:- start:1277 stop:1468 length:192 start_codon:yes stop_codon:yes gene_type:complete